MDGIIPIRMPEGIIINKQKINKSFNNKIAPMNKICEKKNLGFFQKMKNIASNLWNEKQYLVQVDKYDRIITITTIIVLLMSAIFFIWAISVSATQEYIINGNTDSTLNKTFKYWKYAKFILNIAAATCIIVQLYRRGINPVLEECEILKIVNDRRAAIKRIDTINQQKIASISTN